MTVELEKHYNKFCEDKRLTRAYAKVEYYTSFRYIHKYLEGMEEAKILDVGAGTGRYSIPLSEEGYDVTALELVKHNLGVLKSKGSNVKAYQGTALNLKKFKDNTFDMTLVFGPMYHLYTVEDRVKALEEAKRVTKKGGYILVAYLMNEYSILTHGFLKGNIKEAIAQGKVDENFHVVNKEEDLYDYVRIEDIDKINEMANIERVQIIAADGHANFMRQTMTNMDEETFNLFLEYHYKTCERMDLIGASAHTVDILRK